MPTVPKPANKRVRRNAGGVEFREVQITAGEQPDLPERDRPWSQETLEFWESLGESELAADFTNAGRLLHLAGGRLETQVECFALQFAQLGRKLIVSLDAQFFSLAHLMMLPDARCRRDAPRPWS